MKEFYGEILRTVGSNHDQRNEIESTNEITIITIKIDLKISVWY